MNYSRIWFEDTTTEKFFLISVGPEKKLFNWCDRQNMVDTNMDKYLQR